jgi:hypothetical protein
MRFRRQRFRLQRAVASWDRLRSSERRVGAFLSVDLRETRHPGFLGIRCIGDRFLSRAAGTGGPQGSRHHRRDPRSLVRTRRQPRPSAWGQTEPPAFNVEGHGGLTGRGTMDEIRVPQHVVDRFERRRTARLAQMLEGRQPLERVSGCDDPLRSPQVWRLVGSLRPPTNERPLVSQAGA